MGAGWWFEEENGGSIENLREGERTETKYSHMYDHQQPMECAHMITRFITNSLANYAHQKKHA